MFCNEYHLPCLWKWLLNFSIYDLDLRGERLRERDFDLLKDLAPFRLRDRLREEERDLVRLLRCLDLDRDFDLDLSNKIAMFICLSSFCTLPKSFSFYMWIIFRKSVEKGTSENFRVWVYKNLEEKVKTMK